MTRPPQVGLARRRVGPGRASEPNTKPRRGAS